MANEKQLKSRLLQKHDTEENWNKATNFIPKAGEIIVYDDGPRIKIGDGAKTVTNLDYASNIKIIDIDMIPEEYSTYENILSMQNKGLAVYLQMLGSLIPFSGVDYSTGNLKFIGPVTSVDNINLNITISQNNNITVSYSCSAPIVLTGEMTSDTEGVITSSDMTLELIATLYQQDTPPTIFLSIPAIGLNIPAVGVVENNLIATFEEYDESSIYQMLIMFDIVNKVVNISSNEIDIVTPNELTKEAVGLSNVENKSSATIRGELTKANVVAALGYTPPEQDTNTTYENATSSTAGLMSAADKDKLDKIAAGATANTGTITGVTAGNGLTGGGTSGSVTLNVGAGTGITVAADTVGVKLKSTTALTNDSTAATETSGRVYPVAVDKSGNLAVNVPWTDTNTTSFTIAADASDDDVVILSGTNGSNKVTYSASHATKGPSTTASTTKGATADVTISGSAASGSIKVPKVTVDKYGHTTGLTEQTLSITMPTIPTSLKNPNALTFTGAATGSYDGSAAKTVNIPTIPSSLKNPNALTVGGKTYDGSSAISITAADLGLSAAMKFLGTSATAITDGATTNPITIGTTSTTVSSGNVVLYGSKEFVWNGSSWEELGNEGSYKVVQAAVSSPTTSGTTTAFIDTISQDTNGKITATKKTVATATTSAAGLMSSADKIKLDGIATGATANVGTITGVSANGTSVATSGVADIPAASTSKYGVTKLSSATNSTSTSLAATPSAVKAAYDLAASKASTDVATTSANGLMSSSDKTKLNGIATGAEVNQNAFSNITIGSTTIAADTKTDTLTLVAGSNVTLTPDATNDKITIAATDTTYSAASQSAAGLMSADDKKKLDGIATGANNYTYTLPTASSSTLGGVKVGSNLSISNGVLSVPTANGTTAGVTIVYPAASCTTYSSDSGTVTPLAVQKGAKMFAITRPTSSTNKAITRYSNTTGDVQDSKIIIEDVTNTKDTSKTAQVIAIPAEGGKKMVYGYCTDQTDGTSFIGGVFDANATTYPYNQGLAIGGTSGNLLWKGVKVATANDLPSAATTSTAGLMSASDKSKLDAITASADAVSFSRSLTSGTKIGSITINGTATDIYAPTDTNTTYSAATTSAAGLMSAADKTKLNNSNIAYATCSTTAATAAKVATLSGNTNWALTAGAIVAIKFTETNTADNPTININSTGAKSVVYGTAAITTSNLSYAGYASRVILYMYDGTNYVFLGWSYDANSDTKVTQANTTADTTYNVLLSYGAASTSSVTNTVKKSANLKFNPSTKTLTVANVSGNASSATKLATARKINGIAFDGTADIVVPSSVNIGIITLTANGWVEDATLGAFKQTAAIPNLANGHKVDLDADLNTINQLPASIVPYNDNGTFYAVTLTPPSVDIAVQYTLLATN